ncbi:MAG: hypothetical protein LUH05_09010 [Candidatus Gastranaerophilales bacterium]|nr:hypothetical protein [Candidatus Gastranaerophilales bacterium]
MKNKKIFKIITVNIIILLILFFLIDITVYYRRLYMSYYYEPPFIASSYFSRIFDKLGYDAAYDYIFNDAKYRKVENKNSDKESIVLLGCSFTEGAGLEKDETFSYKLGQYTKRPIYNRAKGGWGVQHALFQLQSEKFYDIISKSKPPKYVIYTYIGDHVKRIHIANEPVILGGYPIFVYKKVKDNLVFDNFSNLFFHFPSLSAIKQGIFSNFSTTKSRAKFLKLHFLQSAKALKQHYRDSKFVILIFDGNNEIFQIRNDLKKEGIIIVTVEDLIGNKDYGRQLDGHPNADTWDLVTPKLVEYLDNYNEEDVEDDDEDENIQYDYKVETSASNFSICNFDRQLIAKKEISSFRASIAYISFCIGHFLDSLKLKFIANIFKKTAAKLNPKNRIYEEYIIF